MSQVQSAALDEAYRELAASLGDRVATNVALGKRTTYRVGGDAAIFAEIATETDLELIADVAHRYGLPMLVIGRGSNMLVADEGFAGIAATVAGFADEVEIDQATSVVTVGGGVDLPRVARQTAAAGVTGFEWAVGVPGSIGGAVRMNAGGHGSDMAACLIDIDVVEMGSPPARATLTRDEIGLRFRASDLSPQAIVVRARLQLAPGDPETSKALIAEIVQWRRDNQPGGQNCGSVFVNPVPGEVTAGALIEQAGLRGFRLGDAWVSDKHANFIQAGEGASAADVKSVIEHVRAAVERETGYRLRSEVRLVGFPDANPFEFEDRS